MSLTTLACAFCQCVRFRALLWLQPVETLDPPPPGRRGSPRPPREISRAVSIAARLVPGASCLTQALAVRELMLRAGHHCQLRYGVATEGGFRAHAWIEHEGKTLHGETRDHYHPLQ